MTTQTKVCSNRSCTNPRPKNKWGNYMPYCCDECMKISKAAKFKETYANKDIDAISAKRKVTVQEKYGVDNVAKTADVRAKLKVTTTATATTRTQKTKINNMEKYGVESTNSLQSIKDLKKETFIEKYGVDHQLKIPSVAAKVSAANTKNADKRLAKAAITNIEKYGCENPSSNEEVKQRRTDTMIERFGVENASQNAEVHARQMQPRMIKYTFPSGNNVNVMGYEPQALSILENYFLENDIILGKGNMPEIWYELHGKRRYYPDIYIPKENLIIEVKSQWTWQKDEDTLNKNLAKKYACIAAGYKYLLMMFNSTGKILLTEMQW